MPHTALSTLKPLFCARLSFVPDAVFYFFFLELVNVYYGLLCEIKGECADKPWRETTA